ncbi:unnamed protein product [Urochloa decumbens]|uniref:Uncharacterized protein n=1 Tax=Urochloa decumbens TaxID=240449 RepID=A0ABC9EF87_9POAL
MPPWRLGVVDGESAPRRALERGVRSPPRSGPHNGRGDGRGEDRRREDKEERERERQRRGYNNDHPDRWNVWRRKDDDDDRDRRDHDDRSRRGAEARKDSTHDARRERERERSPRRRHWGGVHTHRGRHHADTPTASQDADKQPAEVLPPHLPQLMDLRSIENIHMQFLFRHQASTIQEAAKNFLNKGNHAHMGPTLQQMDNLFADYITKAAVLADKLSLTIEQGDGTEAWSSTPSGRRAPTQKADGVPVAIAFDRILAALPASATHADSHVSVPEVEAALRHLKLSCDLNTNFTDVPLESPTNAAASALNEEFITLYRAARQTPVAEQELQMPTGGNIASAPDMAHTVQDMCGDRQEAQVTPATAASGMGLATESPAKGHNNNNETILHALFTTPAPALLQQPPSPMQQTTSAARPEKQAPAPPAPQKRRRRVFDMSTEFLAMFQGPLPQHIIAALTIAFNLDDTGAEELDEALAAVAGEGIDDMQLGVGNIEAGGLPAGA